MESDKLARLLVDLESDRVERKASLSDLDKIRKTICAFANDLPGHRQPSVVFVGANDEGGCAHFEVTDESLRRVSEVRTDITPFPSIEVKREIVSGCELMVVIVQPSHSPPVRFRGRIWIRVGPTLRTAGPDDERRLNEKRRGRDLPYDLQPFPSASIEDLDLRLFENDYLRSAVPPDVLEQNERTVLEQLTSMRFITVGPEPHPTFLGLLVVGRDPRAFIPAAYIQFLRLDGTTLDDPIKDAKEIDGPLPEMLRELIDALRINISTSVDVTSGPVETRRPDFPFVALYQLAVNAVLHRNYDGTNAPVRIHWFDDRVEIQSPGGPFGQVTESNFGQPGMADYRNPHLAETMKGLGFVQKFGLGIQLAEKELRKNGNPMQQFHVDHSSVVVTIRGA